jgi:hypothetical protein
MMELDSAEAGLLRELEQRLMHPSVRASPDQVARLLAEEFIEFGSSGRVYDKRQIIELLQQEQETASPPTVTDFSARRLSADVMLLIYRVVENQTIKSSIWKFADRKAPKSAPALRSVISPFAHHESCPWCAEGRQPTIPSIHPEPSSDDWEDRRSTHRHSFVLQ